MRIPILITVFLFSTSALAGFYKWTDADGKVHYSDRPVEDKAEQMHIPGTDIRPEPEDDEESDDAKDAKAGEKGKDPKEERTPEGQYSEFQILEPEQNQTIRSDEGEVRVAMLLIPGKLEGHEIVVKVDGTPLSNNPGSTQLILNQVQRGSHTLDASIVNEKGETVISAPTVHFHMRKAALPTASDEESLEKRSGVE